MQQKIEVAVKMIVQLACEPDLVTAVSPLVLCLQSPAPPKSRERYAGAIECFAQIEVLGSALLCAGAMHPLMDCLKGTKKINVVAAASGAILALIKCDPSKVSCMRICGEPGVTYKDNLCL